MTNGDGAPGAELRRLDALVGMWTTRGQTVAGPSIEIAGTDTYEWVAGGFFLLHTIDVFMGEDHVEAIEVIGAYDRSSETFAMTSFDNQGAVGMMRASVNADGSWTFAGDAERATLTIADDGTGMSARWERTDDGSSWHPWMDLRFTRLR